MKERLNGIFESNRMLYTKSITPGVKFFEEETIRENGEEYRNFNPTRSKLAAGAVKGIKETGIQSGSGVLYLGAAHGYTVSFVSDIIGSSGFIFAVDFAPRVVRDLVFVAEKRENIAPILADANRPESYFHRIAAVDVLYQDIAQKNQTEIFLKNAGLFLKKGGYGIIAVKARSIDVTKEPKKIFHEVKNELEKEMAIIDYRILEPFQRAHAIFVLRT